MSPTVALVGATGNLGPAILNALLKADFNVVILSRHGSKTTESISKHPNQRIVNVDYSNNEELKQAFQGVDVVVSTPHVFETQKLLIDAALAAGVRRFLPSEFGSDISQPVNQKLPVFKAKLQTREYIEEVAAANPQFTYTYVVNNAFLDWGIKANLVLNVKDHKQLLVDGGDVPFSLTTLASVGKAVVGVINNLDATKNRAVFVRDVVVTEKQLVEIAKSIDGKKWETEVKYSADLTQVGFDELKKPEPDVGKAMVHFLYGAAFGKDSKPDFAGTSLDNELLGLSEFTPEQLKETIKSSM